MQYGDSSIFAVMMIPSFIKDINPHEQVNLASKIQLFNIDASHIFKGTLQCGQYKNGTNAIGTPVEVLTSVG